MDKKIGFISGKDVYRCMFVLIFLFAFSLIYSGIALCRDINDAVVKIFVASNRIDFYKPWQSYGMKMVTGSGCIIKGNKILTNAHVVADHTFIQVKKNTDSKRYIAHVEAIGYECDLALLSVDDPEFFKGVEPLEYGGLPHLQDTVTVIGYPQGGDKLSITKGVVSRIEVTSYSQSSRDLLAVQIDAAINPGNSGGPVIDKNGKLIGIAMQVLNAGQNIGYIIPMPIINHFFDDIKDGHFDGFPILGIEFEGTENPTLRKYYKIDNTHGGVLVSSVIPFTPAYGKLKEGDIVVEIGGIPIGEDATFLFRKDERLSMTYLITKKQIGDNLLLKIIRDGKPKIVSVKLNHVINMVPYPRSIKEPSYYIFGGMVFTVLSVDLLQSWGRRWWEKAPIGFNYYLIGPGRFNKEKRKQVVVLLNIFPDDINVGYYGQSNEVISKVNGKKFKSFKEFVQLLVKAKKTEKYTVIETEDNSHIILENKHIDEINKAILKRNHIPYQCSDDVKKWLEEINSQN